jgi:hypothetical protein
MDEELKKLLANRQLVSFRVTQWIGIYTKGEVCNMLGFTRPTLETRLKLHNWKMSEVEIIIKKIPF